MRNCVKVARLTPDSFCSGSNPDSAAHGKNLVFEVLFCRLVCFLQNIVDKFCNIIGRILIYVMLELHYKFSLWKGDDYI